MDKTELPVIDHIAITVPDLALARDFYTGLLGLEETHRTSWQAGNARMDALMGLSGSAAEVLILRAGNIEIEFFEFRHLQAEPQPERNAASLGYMHFALKVTGIGALYDRLVAAGTVFHTPPYVGRCGRTLTYLRDPFGNIVELVEGELLPLADRPQA